MTSISPGVLLNDGTTYYPKGYEWLLAFALRGCQWAIEALETPDVKAQIQQDYDPIETVWGEV